MKTKPELLAPAGNMLAFRAALAAGADAVYLGAAAFGARASAGFDWSDLQAALNLAHLNRRRVYVTVNTLVKQPELQAAQELLARLDQMGVDAVIMQDLGLVTWAAKHLPNLAMHASTQMSIHNVSGAQLAKGMGMQRVVLARECSLETIADIAATGIEVETFVHGALCVSVSGQCLLSSQIGGRSGNRGRCAQPCRLGYTYRGKQGAWLSPRDLSLLEDVDALVEAGVASFKIEGRLKSPEYVASAVRSYRHMLDAAWDKTDNTRLQQDKLELQQVFSRGGFTRGMAFGRGGKGFINPLRVAHEGTPLGTIISSKPFRDKYLSEARLQQALHDGDQLQIRGAGEQDFIYSGPDMPAGATVTLRHHKLAKAGSSLHKLFDAPLMKSLQQYQSTPIAGIPLSATLCLSPGHPATLTLEDPEGTSVTVQGAVPQAAKERPLSAETTKPSIEKMGDSPFFLREYHFDSPSPAFLPISALNQLRREALAAMEVARLQAYKRYGFRRMHDPKPRIEVSDKPSDKPMLYVRSQNLALHDALMEAGANAFIYTPQDFTTLAAETLKSSLLPEDFVCLPRQERTAALDKYVELIRSADIGLMVDNLSQLPYLRNGGGIVGDGVPAWNERTLGLLRAHGASFCMMSSELSETELKSSMVDKPLPLLHKVYGRVTAMLLNHCPERTYRNLDGQQTKCHLCAAGEGTLGQTLTDGYGARYPLMPQRLSDGCLTHLMFHTPLNQSNSALGNHWLLDFTDESVEDCLRITAYYASLMHGREAEDYLAAPYLGRLKEGVL